MRSFLVLAGAALVGLGQAQQYQVYNLGILNTGDTGSRGAAVSSNDIVAGWSGGNYRAFTWTVGGGIVGLPPQSGYNYAFAQAINNNGLVGGYVQTGFNGAYRPSLWTNGAISLLPQLSGTTGGKIFSISNTGYM